ncbi:MAG TPA: Gfo/Idh/MocA family oxidoreductase [Phycisphaerales bacterium]|nr:Gfo/Idh/MocA family oxidoreductase [Phycisphaerales bacterium]
MLRLGFIGAGAIAEVHADAAQRAGSAIAGFFDADLQRAHTLATKYNAKTATSSLATLLASDCDAVVVAVPNYLHREMAVAALSAGKDLMLEKPMAMNLAECDAIIAAARSGSAGPQIVMLNFVCRSSPAALSAQSLIETGRLGRLYHVKASIYRRRGIPGLGRWFTTRSQSGGGVLVDIGVHVIDLALTLAGSPAVERVSGHVTSTFGAPIDRYRYTEMWAGPPDPRGVFDVEDGAVALIRLAGGITFELNVTWAANLPEGTLPTGMTLLGEKGGCHFDVWGSDLTLTTEENNAVVDLKQQLALASEAWPSAWQRQHEIFATAVKSRMQPEASMACGRAVQATLEAIYRSSERGREVEIES